MKESLCCVYRIINMITGETYIGSSKNYERRWNEHKRPHCWSKQQKNPMYQDMKSYGVENFVIVPVCLCDEVHLHEQEQRCMDLVKPEYNTNRAYISDDERPEIKRDYERKHYHTDRGKETYKRYSHSEKRKAYQKKYDNQLCEYNGEVLSLHALRTRFSRLGVQHPTNEAKKYLLKG